MNIIIVQDSIFYGGFVDKVLSHYVKYYLQINWLPKYTISVNYINDSVQVCAPVN